MGRLTCIGLALLGAAVCPPARAEQPTRLVFTDGSPLFAVFEGAHEIYALGCSPLGMQWTAVPEKKISAKEWSDLIKTNVVVADINCDDRTTKFFSPPGGPGGLIFQHHNGKTYFHYVDAVEFMYAIDSDPSKPHFPQKLYTEQQLKSMNYLRGIDFNRRVTTQLNTPIQYHASYCQTPTGTWRIPQLVAVNQPCRAQDDSEGISEGLSP
jgi:hypothetical protein